MKRCGELLIKHELNQVTFFFWSENQIYFLYLIMIYIQIYVKYCKSMLFIFEKKNLTQPYPPSGAWYVSTTVFAGVDIDESDDDPDIMEEVSAPEKYELSENVRRRFEFWLDVELFKSCFFVFLLLWSWLVSWSRVVGFCSLRYEKSLCLSFLFSAFSYLEKNRVLKINLSNYRK